MTNSFKPNPMAERMPLARDKIRSLPDLAKLVADYKAAGETVVHCHGVFDLLHMGHVRHFEVARREGMRLVVTLTGDEYVNKGPGRPIFSEHLRAEMVAAIEYVDAVGINQAATAEPVIAMIKPDVYVKGSDYENPDEDITGKIAAERELVESHGGRIVFTKDVTFSSSSLINRFLDVYDPAVRDYLDTIRTRGMAQQILDLVESVKDYKVLLVGDTIIDEYQFVSPMGKSPKENMIATLFRDRELFAGGVIAAANHVASMCAEVEVLTLLGMDDPYEHVVRDALQPNVRLSAIYRPEAPTTRKCRFVDVGYTRKLFEVYHMRDDPFGAKLESDLRHALEARLPYYDVVIVTDFGHGMITRALIDLMTEKARFLAVNAQSNSANMGFNFITKYPRADYICIDAPEARWATGEKFRDIAEIAAEVLPSQIDCDRMIITHGAQGCLVHEAGEETLRIPAFTKTVVDTIGAGDAFLAVTSPLVAAGGNMEQVAFIGNAAGAIKVGIVGHRRSVEKTSLVKYLTALLK
jgi:rfaE bifunctional protein kinase chain/domain/rfaE bifunctional protein nucleotidyltransferase chain/domain